MARPCPESRKTVFVVDDCPKNKTQWEERKKLKQCQLLTNATCNHNRRLEYHCLLNAERDKSLEVCAPNTYLPAGTCPDYSLKGERINGAYDCRTSLGKYCPDKQFYSNTVYKYNRCLEKTTSAPDHAQPGNKNVNIHSQTASENATLPVVLPVTILISLIIIYVIVMYVRFKRSGEKTSFWTYLRRSCPLQLKCRNGTSTDDDKSPLLDSITILLVGRTGSGKSSTGNTILKADKFETRISGSSVTKRCLKERTRIGGRNVFVIDTPGLFDTDRDDEKDSQFDNMFKLAKPGPTAIIIVIAAANIRPEEIKTLHRISDVFENDLKRCGILLFTKRDELEKDGMMFNAYLNTIPEEMNQFLLKHGLPEPIAFDNTRTGRKNREQVLKLLSVIDNFSNNSLGNTEDHVKIV